MKKIRKVKAKARDLAYEFYGDKITDTLLRHAERVALKRYNGVSWIEKSSI